MPSPWIFWLIGAVFIIYGLYRLVRLYLRYHQVYASLGWPKVDGVVTNARVASSATSSSTANRRYYWAEIRYAYSASGAKFVGKFQVDTFNGSEDGAQKNAARYPAGKIVKVRYNPKKPKEFMTATDLRNVNNLSIVWVFFIIIGIALSLVPVAFPKA